MSTIIEHPDGSIVVATQAGGTGGGATGISTRPALWDEIKLHLERSLKVAEAAFEAAKAKLETHMEAAPLAPVVEGKPAPERAASPALGGFFTHPTPQDGPAGPTSPGPDAPQHGVLGPQQGFNNPQQGPALVPQPTAPVAPLSEPPGPRA